MSHKEGTRLDGIATLEDLRQRCVVDEDTGCWHLRTARGRPMPKDRSHVLWAFGIGHITATRLSWMLSRPGRALPASHVAYRCCHSYDCVAPEHVKSATRPTWLRHMAASGKAKTPARADAARKQLAKLGNAKLTPELRQWLIESKQNGCEVAHALGITQSRANCIRAAHRKALETRPASSVFELAMRWAA